MRWFITKKHLVALIGILVATILILLMSGCTSTSERSQTSSKRVQIEESHPTPDGGLIKKTTEYIDGEKTAESTTKADIDWAGAVSKGVGQAATGDWVGLGVTAATMLGAGGAAVMTERRRRMRAEADADEHYNDYKKLKESTSA